MRIVIEGPDLSGKSTLADQLGERLNMPVRHGIQRVGGFNVYGAQDIDFMEHPHAILDRCYWMSDLIYEPLTTGRPSAYEFKNIDMLLTDPNTVYIILCPDMDIMTERYNSRGDELQTWETIVKAWKRYNAFANYWLSNPRPHRLLFGCGHDISIDELIQSLYLMEAINGEEE